MQGLLEVAWSRISHESYCDPCFDIAFPTFENLAAAYQSANLTSCDGLSNVIEAEAPPPVSWFMEVRNSYVQDSSLAPAKRWAMYLHVLDKPGCKTLLYLGSATDGTSSIRRRCKDYRLQHALAAEFLKALKDGYEITSTVLLARGPLPEPAIQPLLRALYVAIETAFDAIFWPMRNINTDYGHLGDNVIWSRASFSWAGLCTHSPLMEGVKRLDLSDTQLEEAAETRRLRKNERHRTWLKQTNEKMRANPTPEFKAERVKINKRRKKRRKNIIQADMANATHHYDLCDKTYTTAKILAQHKKTPLHTKRAARGRKDFYCPL